MKNDFIFTIKNYKHLDLKDQTKEIKYLDFAIKKNSYLGLLQVDNDGFFANFFRIINKEESFKKINYSYITESNNFTFKKNFTIGKQVYLNLLLNFKFSKDLAYKNLVDFYTMINWNIGTSYHYKHVKEIKKNELIKLAILKASILEKELIILENIDKNLNANEILDLKLFINSFHNKLTILIISSNIAWLSSIVDECIVIFDNRIVEGGDIKEIIEDPYHPITWEVVLKSQDLIYDKFFSYFKDLKYDFNKKLFDFNKNYILNIELLLKPIRKEIKENHFVYSWLYSDLNLTQFIKPKINQ
ncbi:oligopeptide/dipeptide ABC transporter, ATP-binding protein [Candidatus Hepatoplasma crinochetorum Av]|uniref:Oligopeptide/dipeptide ABC transporter, ATP-binding protein n=1 Tax=Candidatus Hepatoplasma crinochetorum Av TaxID=1427984 RepID=W8GJY3_9MOLU|nr:hypothetical protein [Candidatus Hepatoplasma crinochetorum]AHK22542.1 oligopeptide/dipeptide ABC transporter, ATP-binding protein [Candidatus Hepatoplasma crinochetorum Av]